MKRICTIVSNCFLNLFVRGPLIAILISLNAQAQIPNDRGLYYQYGLQNNGQLITNQAGRPGADISAYEGWTNAPRGMEGDCRTTPVAVIDSGQTFNHPDLQDVYAVNSGEIGLDSNNVDKRFNGIDDDQNGYVDDWRGWNFLDDNNDLTDEMYHGTHISGIIGAQANNPPIFFGGGITGVCQKAKILMLKTSDPHGNNNLFDIIEAIYYQASFIDRDGELTYKVSNNSYGAPGLFAALPVFEDAIRDYTTTGQKGGLFIAAAGNTGWDNDDWTGCNPNGQYNCWGFFPASFTLPRIISVASTNNRDELSSFSNWGTAGSVDLAAPGEKILSTMPLSPTAYMLNLNLRANFEFVDGTSMATPMVAGAAAYVWSLNPYLTADQVKRKILLTTDRLSTLVSKTVTEGRLNLDRASR